MFFSSKPKSNPVEHFSELIKTQGALVRLNGIGKQFKTPAGKTDVLKDIDLEIQPGEFITIMGPSGAGKSTLLQILGLLDNNWNGEYFLAGKPVHQMNHSEQKEWHKQTIGFVFQQFHLLDSMTVYENLDLPLSYRNIPSSERSAMVCDALDRFEIVGKKDLFPSQLSGGQQQLVAVARAVIANPKLLLADEPTGNLHSKQGEDIMELFTQLNQEGATIVQVTHSDKNAAYSQRIINLWDGEIRNDIETVEAQIGD